MQQKQTAPDSIRPPFHGNADPILVVRHGQSIGQINPDAYRTVGDHKLPLTQLGHIQAIETGVVLENYLKGSEYKTAQIIHGGGVRLVETARDIRATLRSGKLIQDDRFNKQRFGLFDGLLTNAQRQAAYPAFFETYKTNLESDGAFHVKPPEGESISDLVERVSAGLHDLAEIDGPKIIVTHGLPFLAIQLILENRSNDWLLKSQDSIQNCAVRLFNRQADGSYRGSKITAGDAYQGPEVKNTPVGEIAGTGSHFTR